MAVSEAARKNHEELFPGHVSTLAVTDPELIEVFDNFAFDEVVRDSRLDPRIRLMVQLAALIASQAVREYRVMLGAALTLGVTPVAAREIVYQAVPCVGMAKVLDSLQATNEVLTDRGVELPLPGQATTTPATRAEAGRALQEQIVGREGVDKLYASAPPDEARIQRYLSANCFGDHLTRTGIGVCTRELLTFSMLVSLGGCEPQVRGHVAANLNVGRGRRPRVRGPRPHRRAHQQRRLRPRRCGRGAHRRPGRAHRRDQPHRADPLHPGCTVARPRPGWRPHHPDLLVRRAGRFPWELAVPRHQVGDRGFRGVGCPGGRAVRDRDDDREPGGARTEFRYGSARVANLMPLFDNTPAHGFQRMLDPRNGLAPGDPARMAGRIIESVDLEPAPLRMVLGSQALEGTLATLRARIAGFETQAALAASTDYPQGE